MQETDFIEQNKEKWREFEDVLLSPNKDPERLTELFIETTDDLSYSRTYYANRSVRVYLNGIAQQVYQVIYRNKKREKNAFMNFWTRELPDVLWYNRGAIYFSFILFMVGLAIGLVSSMYYPEFARVILGDSYVEMTKANIEKGDPMAVYKDSEPMMMFLQIALNNIKVSFFVFVVGILFGVGTVFIILSNAVMVGAFIQFFIERGLFRESFLAIMLHGTLELSMIVVAGAAGFTLARGLIFPGTFRRGQALALSARSGIKMMIGVSVLLLYAAFIESFLTRHTDMGDGIRAGIILLSAALVVGYFVIYPRYRFRRGFIPEIQQQEIPRRKPVKFGLDTIKSGGKIFTETFDLFAANARIQFIMALCAAIIITVVFGFFVNLDYHLIDSAQRYLYDSGLDSFYPWNVWDAYIDFDNFPYFFPLLLLMFVVFALITFSKANKRMNVGSSVRGMDVWNFIFITAIAMTPLLLPHQLTFLVMPLSFPFFLLWMYVSFVERMDCFTAIARTFSLVSGNFWRMIGAFISVVLIQWIIMFILAGEIIDFIVGMITQNIPRNAPLAEQAYLIIRTFIIFFVPACIMSLGLYSTALFYYSAREANEAGALMKAIQQVGFKKRAYGIEQEA